MKITIALVALALSALALSVPSSHSLDYTKPYHIIHPSCICQPDLAILLHTTPRQSKRSYHEKIAVSPADSSPPPPPSPTTGSSPSSSQTNTAHLQNSKLWPPSTETIVTSVFRAVITILSLLNVNFTWRIHGNEALYGDFLTDTNMRHRYPCRPRIASWEETSASSCSSRTCLAGLMLSDVPFIHAIVNQGTCG